MQDKKKLLIYPIDNEFSPVVRHQEMLKDFEIVALVSPISWGMNKKNAGALDGGDNLNLIITNDFENSLTLCDVVLFSESCKDLDFDKIILPKFTLAAKERKNILFLRNVQEENLNILKEICSTYNVDFKSYNEIRTLYFFNSSELTKLEQINTPIIFVGGLFEKTQKFEIQLSLRESLNKIGYKVSQVGTKNYCELLGFHSFPQFMYIPNMNEEKKIIAFNHLIKSIELNENPDVIIIGIPGGTMKINNTFTGNFGILAYEISQAITPDVSVFSVFYENFNYDYLDEISKSIKYKLGFNISCFNISNTKFDWQLSKVHRKESYLMLDSEFIESKKEQFKAEKSVFNILNADDKIKMANFLIDTLSYYSEIESV